jgi:hypothetical protein
MKKMKNRVSQVPLIKPVFTVFILALLSYLIYYGSRHIENQNLHESLATIFGAIYFLSIFFGPFYIFTSLYVQGIPLTNRILAASLIPFLWMTKDESHPFLESLY